MLKSNNINWNTMTDMAIARQLGEFIRNVRLQKNLTQTNLAINSGLNRSTISEIENGRPASLISFIQILRVLDLLDSLDVFVTKSLVSPLLMAQMEATKRKRASLDKNIQPKNTKAEW